MCTLEKQGNLYILTLTGPGEHRLNPKLIDSIQSALRLLRDQPLYPSSALITTAHGKFFCNGYDLAWGQSASSAPITQSRFQLMSLKFRSLISDLISLPMPTIAAVTGHSSTAGFMLALGHDYVLMRKDRGFIYMSELDIGCDSCLVYGDVVLTAAKLTAEMAVERRIVHSAHESAQATVEAAVGLGNELVRRKWDGRVYANNRLVVLGEVLDKIGFDETVEGQNGDSTKSKL
ncbi:hypothetical protein P3X46_014224 [Hevea brasiliensis]|uniref:Uncharacterized protein n=1 Tax=Hevea brasiliensis TaxID=3981 RepID=A0ABQ9M7Q9_HEVBR|nr:hypothetical protein P3X46_014224 [Hevea brasiliensis]